MAGPGLLLTKPGPTFYFFRPPRLLLPLGEVVVVVVVVNDHAGPSVEPTLLLATTLQVYVPPLTSELRAKDVFVKFEAYNAPLM
jgi:hypothetical protein